MTSVVISGTGLYHPSQIITNAELVESFNRYVELYNARHADEIAAGTREALQPSSVEAVVNARGQFEPVMRAGGDWRRLPASTVAQRARIETILNLALEGRLPDLTNGARFFQNPQIVADRARRGEVSEGLVNFGGTGPSAVIGAHSFYVEARSAGGRGPRTTAATSTPRGSSSGAAWQAAGGYTHDFAFAGLNWSSMIGYRAVRADYSRGTGLHRAGMDAILHGPTAGLGLKF